MLFITIVCFSMVRWYDPERFASGSSPMVVSNFASSFSCTSCSAIRMVGLTASAIWMARSSVRSRVSCSATCGIAVLPASAKPDDDISANASTSVIIPFFFFIIPISILTHA